MALTEDIFSNTPNQPPAEARQSTWLQTTASTVDALWAGLRRPWLLALSGLVIVLLLASAMLLPQLPGELRDNPTAARRWLASISAEYGGLGALARTFGLFNILHSTALLVMLVVIGLVLCVHLGDLLAAVAGWRRLPHLLRLPPLAPGEPLPANAVQTLHRLRAASAQPVDDIVEKLYTSLAARFDGVEKWASPLAAHQSDEGPLEDKPDSATESDVRILATRHQVGVMLRPALMLGLLLALVVVWLIVTQGWEVTSPVLAPGDEYRLDSRQLQLQYTVTLQSGVVHPMLNIRLGQMEHSPVVTDAKLSLAGVSFQLRPSAPGLHIATVDGTSALARAGQAETSPGIGLTFPSPGSEEAIILPQQSVGLRIIRLADTTGAANPTFMVEVYDSERSQPTQRVEIEATQVADIQIDGQGFVLRVLPIPGVVVNVQYLPALWLLWPALVLVLLGAAGYWLRPAFVLVQVVPWPANRSVVVVQSDRRQELEQASQQLMADDKQPTVGG